MRRKFTACAVLFFVLISSIGSVQARTVTYFGRPSCANWNEELDKSIKNERGLGWIGHSQNKAWMVGFVSGANALMDGNLIAEINAKLMEDWVSKYCLEHPDSDVAEGALKLLLELRKVSKKSPEPKPKRR